MSRRPTPPPLTKTERTHLDDLIRRGARALNPTEANRLLRLLELDHADRQQERRTAGGLMGQVQSLGGQLKDMTAERDRFAAGVPLICSSDRHEAKVRGLEAQLAAVRALAADMRTWCSPHGIATDYADRIDEALDGQQP